MRSASRLLLLTAACLLAANVRPVSADDQTGFHSIFDGKTLKGWDGDPKFWSVKEGAITGRTTKENPTKGNTFIIWTGGKTGDFELKLQYRIVADNDAGFANSGIQYRSFHLKNAADKWRIGGYQADFENGNRFSGILYGERFRGILCNRGQKTELVRKGGKFQVKTVGKVGDSKAIQAKIKKADWNDYHVIAKGFHFVHKINGITTADCTDNDKKMRRASGLLALQLHAGRPMTVQFRNIRIKQLGHKGDKTGLRIGTPGAGVAVDKGRVRVRAPLTGVDVDKRRVRVRIGGLDIIIPRRGSRSRTERPGRREGRGVEPPPKPGADVDLGKSKPIPGSDGECGAEAPQSKPKSASVPVTLKKIVLIAGRKSHGYGAHEHKAGCMLLAEALNESGLPVKAVVVTGGWPKDDSILDEADSIVIYADGGGGHPFNRHLARIDKLMKKGVGLVCIHYGVEVPKGKSGDAFLDWTGGYFETNWSVNPHWTADYKKLPKHPISRGVKPFRINDEWYYHMRFRPKGVTPILTDLPPKTTLRRKDGPHSGNKFVRAEIAKGIPQHMAWATERKDGGRGFGFTGGHNHWNWGHNQFRKLMLNAIVWTANVDVPKTGVSSKPLTVKDLMANQDYKVPGNFNPLRIQKMLDDWNGERR